MTETKLPGMVINRIDKKSTYDSLVKKGEIGENDLCLVEDEDSIPPGGTGTDISLGVTGASVGDIIKVKQVDANGKPTAWEAAGATEDDNMPLLYHQTVADTITDFTLDAIDGVALSLSAVKISAILKAVEATWTGIKVWIDAVSPNNDPLGADSGGVRTVADKWYAGFAEAKFNNQVLENCTCDFKQFTPYTNEPMKYTQSVTKSVPMFTYQNPPTIMTTPNAKINKIQIFGTFSNLEVMIWGQ